MGQKKISAIDLSAEEQTSKVSQKSMKKSAKKTSHETNANTDQDVQFCLNCNDMDDLAHRLVAFMRGGKAITVAPRLAVGLGDDWQGTAVELPPGIWEDAFSGERFRSGAQKLSRLLIKFPVALLVRQGGNP